MEFTTAEATALIGGYFWPFLRIGAMLMSTPVFGAQNLVSSRTRVGLAMLLTVVVLPSLPPAPAVDPFGWQGLVITLQQLLLGIAMGFALQLAFSALIVAGQAIAMTMGLGFASFVDPSNGLTVPVVSMFYTIVGTLLFLALNGHLIAIQVLIESFRAMPVGAIGMSTDSMLALALWGGRMFTGALLIALPALVTITLINVAFGVMTRAAPQLNIFAVGFPTTMFAGFLVIFLTLPNLLPRFTTILMDAFDLISQVLVGAG